MSSKLKKLLTLSNLASLLIILVIIFGGYSIWVHHHCWVVAGSYIDRNYSYFSSDAAVTYTGVYQLCINHYGL